MYKHKLNVVNNILNSIKERFTEIGTLIGPAGEIPMALADTEFTDQATNISVLFDELNIDIADLQREIQRET